MKKRLSISKVNGVIKAPPSKSVMIRAVAASLLSGDRSIIINPSMCMDSLAVLNIAKSLGADVIEQEGFITITGNKGLKEKSIKDRFIDCCESGLCIRMFAPISGLIDKEITLSGKGTLLSRPVGMVEELIKIGALCKTKNGLPPISIKGPLRSGIYTIDGSETSQFLTGLIMALPLCEGDSEFEIVNLKSKPYLKMTVKIMETFGVLCLPDSEFNRFYIKGSQDYSGTTYTIEGDWSGSSFMLVAGAIAGSITVTGLQIDSTQADRVVLDILSESGAIVDIKDNGVSVKKGHLKGFNFSADDSPDLVPPLVALASCSEGKTVIYDVERLRHKESNRLDALVREFSKMGVDITLEENRLEIKEGKIKGGFIDSHNDHRIAMACSIAALRAEDDVVIDNAECVAKSYPSFFEDLLSLKEM